MHWKWGISSVCKICFGSLMNSGIRTRRTQDLAGSSAKIQGKRSVHWGTVSSTPGSWILVREPLRFSNTKLQLPFHPLLSVQTVISSALSLTVNLYRTYIEEWSKIISWTSVPLLQSKKKDFNRFKATVTKSFQNHVTWIFSETDLISASSFSDRIDSLLL